MGTHPIFESDFDCLTDIVVRMKLLASLLLVAPHGNALSSQIIWEDGGRIASTNTGAFGASQDLLYRNAEGRKDNLYGMAIDTRAGGESSGMTLWNPADNQALHFVDQDDPDQSKWYISQLGQKTQVSDETMKKNIEEYDPENFMEKFRDINLVTYTRKCRSERCEGKKKKQELGLIAQEAEALGILDLLIQNNSKNPDFVDDGVSSRYYFTYEKLNLIVLKAVQEMTKELEKKEVSLAQIQEANELIENAINKL